MSPPDRLTARIDEWEKTRPHGPPWATVWFAVHLLLQELDAIRRAVGGITPDG